MRGAIYAIVAAVGLCVASPAGAEEGRLSELLGECAADKTSPGLLTVNDIPLLGFRVGHSSNGRDGVFFLRVDTAPHATYTVKFMEGLDPGVAVARKLLTLAQIPHDRLRAVSTDAVAVQTIAQRLRVAAKQRRYMLPQTSPEDQEKRRQEIDLKLDEVLGAPAFKTLLITDLVPAAQGLGDLQRLLAVEQDTPTDDKVLEHAGFVLALKALSMEENQRMLGALFVLDVFLGNPDRLVPGHLNLGNLMVTEPKPGIYCLSAIDNDAYAPDPEYVAIETYLPDKILTMASMDPASKVRVGPVPQSEYYRYLLEAGQGYILPYVYEFTGPVTAFDPARHAGAVEYVPCYNPAKAAARPFGLMPRELAAEFRASIEEVMSDSLAELRSRQKMEDEGMNRCSLDFLISIPHKSIPLKIEVPDDLAGFHDIKLNWEAFERNMLEGADAAVEWLMSFNRKPKKMLNALFEDAPRTLFNPVSEMGLLLRYYHIEERLKVSNTDQSFDADLVRKRVMDHNSMKKMKGFSGYIQPFELAQAFRITNRAGQPGGLTDDARYAPQ
ncbi:hypothetical protein [Pseudooceanicola nanhaiensis]|uniref:hypothetical protein n=1 Tax=Pseudooceanicola nanhaiensis TaxID=375761 RepID=UPI001CD35A57|nr:hypothetical protein [Pseudooceanicola nanhaiensis]MCA0920125.1 hypothetical protein [Pseudooceanicola nanhaiensis]